MTGGTPFRRSQARLRRTPIGAQCALVRATIGCWYRLDMGRISSNPPARRRSPAQRRTAKIWSHDLSAMDTNKPGWRIR